MLCQFLLYFLNHCTLRKSGPSLPYAGDSVVINFFILCHEKWSLLQIPKQRYPLWKILPKEWDSSLKSTTSATPLILMSAMSRIRDGVPCTRGMDQAGISVWILFTRPARLSCGRPSLAESQEACCHFHSATETRTHENLIWMEWMRQRKVTFDSA